MIWPILFFIGAAICAGLGPYVWEHGDAGDIVFLGIAFVVNSGLLVYTLIPRKVNR